jgi:hypothetical protein
MQEQLVHAMLDQQSRTLLDEPVPMLGNVSPRAAARSARRRRNVAAWLKHLENRSRNAPNQNDPMATYDFTWLWREVGTTAELTGQMAILHSFVVTGPRTARGRGRPRHGGG